MIKELKIIVKLLGYFPITTEIKKFGKSGMLNFIAKSGGIRKYQTLFGYEHYRKQWSDETIIKQLSKYDIFPTYKELKESDITLHSAVMEHGGMKKYRLLHKSSLT